MDTVPLEKRLTLAAKRLLSILLSRFRLLFGKLVQLVLHDQLGDLSRRTQRLGSASVESVNYLGGELASVNERLAKIEADLAALRASIEGSGGETAGDAEDVATPQRSN
jgi:hypothetical protein